MVAVGEFFLDEDGGDDVVGYAEVATGAFLILHGDDVGGPPNNFLHAFVSTKEDGIHFHLGFLDFFLKAGDFIMKEFFAFVEFGELA
ncbi:uncharacterized protein METZ01_LOCUS428998, partial [marine metagenome]